MHEDRQAFATYLRHAGWSVVECQTEADIKVARDFMPGDIVLSRDSDMLMYESISTVWRPISAGRILVYDEPSALAALGINRTRSEEHTSELQSRPHLVCRLLLEK